MNLHRQSHLQAGKCACHILQQGGWENATCKNLKVLTAYPGGDRVLEYLPRVVRKDSGIRYIHRVHEQLNVNGDEALVSNIVMTHRGYEQVNRLNGKNERNLRIAMLMPDDEPHAHHCRMRSWAAMGDWQKAKESAEALLALPSLPDAVCFDAHILLAAAHFKLPHEGEEPAEFGHHLNKAKTLDPYSPDVPYLELLAAATKYLAALDMANVPGSAVFLRIGHFWRAGTQVQELVRAIANSAVPATWAKGQVVPASAQRSPASKTPTKKI